MTPTSGITLGHVFRIRIALDMSVLFIVLLLTFMLGAGVFPSWHPAWPASLSWLVAAGAALSFLSSILAHELAHALVAKAYGIPVSSITLFVFGGIANIERSPESPSSEALIAIVGPVTSIGIGIGCLGAAGILAPAWSEDPVAMLAAAGPLTTMLLWLGPVNILLALFNLLPGFPLDGGRILRAGLWKISGDLQKATRGAALAGQTLGWLLITAGIAMAIGISVPVLGRGLVGGLWTALIGWFLNGAARASYQDMVVRRALEHVPVARVLRRDPPPFIDARESLATLFEEVFVRRGARLAMVERDSQVYGVVDARQVRNVARNRWEHTSVEQLTRPLSELPTAEPSDSLYETMQRMVRERLDPLLVRQDGRITGLVSLDDIGRWLELQGRQASPAGSRSPLTSPVDDAS